MDITTMLNSKNPATKAVAEQQLQQHFAHAVRTRERATSDTGSETSNTPGHSPRLAYGHPQPLQQGSHIGNSVPYPSPPAMEHGLPMLSGPFLPKPEHPNENNYHHHDLHLAQSDVSRRTSDGLEAAKAFSCQSCGKGFARRSDLARHERIHSGIRPHVCDHPGCGKQFIQRSALTVHARVHTGEKPHLCAQCGKPFSDSSSLARHRRIHSGKRPYKCPFADCQKTFTRRTTLTRHQNHHSGTIEEAAAATAAVLASRPGLHRAGSDGETYSESGSVHSTPSPAHRPVSLSPSADLPPFNRQTSDLPFNGQLPSHIRNDLPPLSNRSSPSPSRSSFGASQPRPSLTSHPATYGPPPTLEPPAQHEVRRSGSSAASPHLSNAGWHSPATSSGASPGHSNQYTYPEPTQFGPGPPLYYSQAPPYRSGSTESDQYDRKPRILSGEVYPHHS